ncbi:MAG: cobalt-precorrin-6A reductase [Candidatus Ochrobactrum gambitense]|nr:MAG: cobalt-precorrin-6A reductase [Candidatus Ochrobactrum gambitense]WEK15542.1 MAG: cobalt-precorrin-6A reductase [Candidatus Ochrobactrum gambitense]
MPASRPKVIILGGTTEAAQLAQELSALPIEVVTSLAGRTANPAPLPGPVRSGGFGGADGLATYITAEKIDYVIDATHPYAKRISQNAVTATTSTETPLLRLERSQWVQQNGDQWIIVADEEEAAKLIPAGERVFLALGRQHIAPFAARADAHFIMRMIDPTDAPLPADCEILLAKPGTHAQEKQFLMEKRIGLIVCRNSGGDTSYAKIRAARDLALPVMMIARPPVVAEHVTESVEETIRLIRLRFGL